MDYDYSHSVTTMLENLNWPTLQKLSHDVVLYHKITVYNVAENT